MRKLIAVALASSTFGGVIGALAVAATQSQASPGAIAAAVQRVQDRSAEQALRSVNGNVARLESTVASLVDGTSGSSGLAPFLRVMQQNIDTICLNIERQTSPPAAFCEAP